MHADDLINGDTAKWKNAFKLSNGNFVYMHPMKAFFLKSPDRNNAKMQCRRRPRHFFLNFRCFYLQRCTGIICAVQVRLLLS